jgi:hypothetical protein
MDNCYIYLGVRVSMADTLETSAGKIPCSKGFLEVRNGQSYCGKCGRIIPDGQGVQDRTFPNVRYHTTAEMEEMHYSLQCD